MAVDGRLQGKSFRKRDSDDVPLRMPYVVVIDAGFEPERYHGLPRVPPTATAEGTEERERAIPTWNIETGFVGDEAAFHSRGLWWKSIARVEVTAVKDQRAKVAGNILLEVSSPRHLQVPSPCSQACFLNERRTDVG